VVKVPAVEAVVAATPAVEAVEVEDMVLLHLVALLVQ
jgi:hypothetical protein